MQEHNVPVDIFVILYCSNSYIMQTSSKLCSGPADRKLAAKINRSRCWPRYSYMAINNWRVDKSWQSLIHTNNNFHILVIYSKVFQCNLHWSTNRVLFQDIILLFVKPEHNCLYSVPIIQLTIEICFYGYVSTTTTSMLMAWKFPGTQQYKVSTIICGWWHIFLVFFLLCF